MSVVANIKKSVLIYIFGFIIFLFTFANHVSAQVVINEFVPDASPEWVEFYNASASAEYLKSYWLDDDVDFESDSGSSVKKLLAGLNIDDIQHPYFEMTSFLNNGGDSVVLFDPSGAVIDQFQYSASPGDGVSVGRSPDGSGSLVVLAAVTKGSANSGPQPTPVPTSSPTIAPSRTATPTPTLSPTPQPAATTTPKPATTIIPAKTSTAKPLSSSPSSSPTAGDLVLGIKNDSDKTTAAASPSSHSGIFAKIPLAGIILTLGGLFCLGFAGLFLFKEIRKGYTNSSDNQNSNTQKNH